MPDCTALTWITVTPRIHLPSKPSPHVCRVCITVNGQTHHFWREKWIAIQAYIMNNPKVRRFLVTDVFDIHMNPWTSSRVISLFHTLTANRAPLLLSTEDTCWIGHICTRDDVRRFQVTNVSHGRFMQSQFIGTRHNVLNMLTWGLRLGKWDDMLMMYEYIRAHPYAVTMDESSAMFGSLAFASPDTHGEYTCWYGKCSASRASYECLKWHRNICIRESRNGSRLVCPLLWHANGLLSRAFLRNNPQCTRFIGRLK